MTALATWLGNGRKDHLGWRSRLNRSVGDPSSPLSRIARRLIWPRRLKHMRYLAPNITFHTDAYRRFSLHKDGQFLAKSNLLCELLPALKMPTSIVATGPSAHDYPWHRFKSGERFLIAVNGAPTMLQGLGIVPDLLVVTDREFALTGARHLEAAINVPLAIEFLAAAALASIAPHLLIDRPFVILERVNMWHGLPSLHLRHLKQLNEKSQVPFIFPSLPESKCCIGWSHRPELGFFPGRTVVFAALQVAIGRGASDLEIIGMDLSGSGRSYSEGPTKRPTQLQEHYESFILPSFRVMQLALAGKNLVLKNHSSVCPLPPEIFGDFSSAL